MAGRELRDRGAITVDLVGVVGLSAFLLGLTWLQTSEELGFDPGRALEGVLSQLPVTFPAAVLVLAATALELGAGFVLARLARRRAFGSWAEALLAANVAAVLKDTLLLGTLGAFGLFLQPVLIAIDVVLIVVGLWLVRTGRWGGLPAPGAGALTDRVRGIGSLTLAALVGVIWIGPVVLQLASPVVPFVDVLPNYVGPVEHLRTFGWFSPLDATQSPIIGPSRTVLGYDAMLGSLATITDLPGALAIAGFILPHTVLVAAGAHRLASALRGGDAPVGAWALLAFALSQPFARLADARGTVVVVPLVCLGLAVAAELLDRDGAAGRDGGPRFAAPDDPWRIGRGAVIGLALGAAILVHPVIGFFAVATVAIAALARPAELAADAFVAGLTAGLIALPQAATMVGLSLPTLVLGAWLPIAVVAGVAAGRAIAARPRAGEGLVRLAWAIRWPLLVLAVVAVLGGFATSSFQPGRLGDALEDGARLILESSGLLLVALGVGVALGSRGARSPLVLAGLAVGAASVALVAVLPGNLGFLGDALRFEVPKTVHYWLSMVAAAGAATALAHGLATDRLPLLARGAAAAAFVVVAALPLRPAPIDAYHLGEHRWSETFAIDLKYAGSGFWVGYPSSRTVVDAPRQELLDALRGEIDGGRLHHDTPVLHVARTFQQWESTPLGVFLGVFETSLSLEPEVSHQTTGGRLYGSKDPEELLAQARAFLGSHEYGYVVLEPRRLPGDLPGRLREAIVAAGYTPLFANDHGEVFRIGR